MYVEISGINVFFDISGIKAALSLLLHCHYLNESLHANFSRRALQYIGDFGILGFVSGTGLTIFYIFLEIYYQAGEFIIFSYYV